MKLFCFPYAGGGASIFNGWKKFLPLYAGIELVPIQYPGRENYLSRELINDPDGLAEYCLSEMRLDDRPFALWGHSMGGMIAYLITRKLEERGLPGPVRLMVSAFDPPHVYEGAASLLSDDDDEFVRLMCEMNQSSRPALEIPELRDMIVPIMRADLCVCQGFFERYSNTGSPILRTPILTFVGNADSVCSPRTMIEWRQHTDS